MKNTKIPDFFFFTAIALIVLFSYLNFSAMFFPFPDLNTAISILMAPGVSIPGDFYLWGQNFAGTLVPFLAKFLCVIYRFPPDMAVAVVQYGILFCGFLSLSFLFRSRFAKVLLAIIWFFPSWFFLGHLTTVFGIQMSFTGIGIYLLTRFKRSFSVIMKYVWLAASCCAFIISIWISDLAVVSVIVLMAVLARDRKELFLHGNFPASFMEKNRIRKLALVLIFLVAGAGFIFYAKHTAGRAVTYSHPLLNTPGQFLTLIGQIFVSIFNVLIFKAGNIPGSLYAWTVILGIPAVLSLSGPKGEIRQLIAKQKWVLFFILNGVFLFLCLLLSNWVMISNAAGKYFSAVAISLWIAVLVIVEATGSSKPALRNYILLLILAMGIVSSLAPLYFPKNLDSRSAALASLKRLDSYGMIGKTAEVFVAAGADPYHIKAAPCEGDLNRNSDLIKDVFRQQKIFLVRNEWLEDFPDTIRQYGVLLQKIGQPFTRAGYHMCRYEESVKRTIFPVDSMDFQGVLEPDSMAFSGKSVKISVPFDRSKHFVFGPYIDLPKGEYTVLYRLKISRGMGIDNFAVLNVSANFGKTILTKRTIRMADFAKDYDFEVFDVPLETSKDYKGVEFRIMYLGLTDLYFDRVILIQK